MDLWTEYEGVTIDSAFALKRLLQTEGRSAFFSTLNENGESVLIRIIECHFDEDEILARWRGVQTLSHPNFLRIDRFGQFRIEDNGVTAVYAVFERVDANLGEVLGQGCLTAPEAAEIGLSVAAALETLHANGFVHEHIEAGNIYAIGDQVKLRSDCIRETPEDEAGVQARRGDVHDLAMVLRQVLLGMPRDSSAGRDSLLPAPFDEIVCYGMNGRWGLAEIKAALGRCGLPKAARRRTAPPEPVKLMPAAKKTESQAAALGEQEFSAKPALASEPKKPDAQPERSILKPAAPVLLPGQKPPAMELPVIFGISERDFRKWATIGALLLGAILIGWICVHHWSGHDAAAAQQVSTQAAADLHAVATPPETRPSVDPPAPVIGSKSLPSKAGAEPRVEWRVVAFTYNRQDQAQKKALWLAQQHPGLSPAIFAPNGKAPWLVTVGGVLERDAAYALARKARSLGLPRDTYAQNYKVR